MTFASRQSAFGQRMLPGRLRARRAVVVEEVLAAVLAGLTFEAGMALLGRLAVLAAPALQRLAAFSADALASELTAMAR